MTKSDVHEFIAEHVERQLQEQGRAIAPEVLTDDFDLLLSGTIDSLGVLELTTALEEFCGCELDFDSLDPEEMTIVGPLCDFVVSQAAIKSA